MRRCAMNTKIGNFAKIVFFCSGFFSLLTASQRLELRVINKSSGSSVSTLSLGVPYTLELKVEGAHDLYKCTIPGLENFHSEFCGASHLNLMSHITTVHSYVIRADTLGDFTLGPVTLVTKQGTTLTSNVLRLNVEKQSQSDVIIELIFDKKSIVAGQKIGGLLRINSSVSCQPLNISLPPIPSDIGELKQQGNTIQGTRVIDGKNYTCFDVPLTLIFKKAGNYSFSKAGVLCRVPHKKSQRLWGFGPSMHGAQDLWFYSTESIVIEVAPLPALPSNQHLLGIGLFNSVSLTCKQKAATRGEGVVAVLDIIGKEGVEDVASPPLDLPVGLKYYESKISFDALPSGLYKKSCEYIIQATQDRNFEIYPQVYTVFDTASMSYKQLKTNGLQLVIIGGRERFDDFDLQKEQDLPEELIIDEKIAPIKNDGPWVYSAERVLSLRSFFLLIALISAITIFFSARKYRQNLGSDYWRVQRKKNAFVSTRKKLAQLKKNNNNALLYDTFNQLFKDRCQLLSAEVTADVIEERLKKAGFVQESVEQWNRFFLQLAELAYSQQEVCARVPDDLFKRASMWINQLEEKL